MSSADLWERPEVKERPLGDVSGLVFVADGSAIFRAISVKRRHSSLNGTAVRSQLSSRRDSTAVEEAFMTDSPLLSQLISLRRATNTRFSRPHGRRCGYVKHQVCLKEHHKSRVGLFSRPGLLEAEPLFFRPFIFK